MADVGRETTPQTPGDGGVDHWPSAAVTGAAPYVIDRHALVWRVVRDGGMATRADYAGITTIGIVRLEQEAGPLVPFHPLVYLLAQQSPPARTTTPEPEVVADEVLDGGGPASFEDGPPAGWSASPARE